MGLVSVAVVVALTGGAMGEILFCENFNADVGTALTELGYEGDAGMSVRATASQFNNQPEYTAPGLGVGFDARVANTLVLPDALNKAFRSGTGTIYYVKIGSANSNAKLLRIDPPAEWMNLQNDNGNAFSKMGGNGPEIQRFRGGGGGLFLFVQKVDFDANTVESGIFTDVDFDFSVEPSFVDDDFAASNLVLGAGEEMQLWLHPAAPLSGDSRIHYLGAATTFADLWIPEPASMALLALGGLMLLSRRR